MKCLILGAGFGTRLYPLTLNKAKVLLEFKGKPLFTHIIEKIPQGVDIMASANRKFEADFRQWQESIEREVELCIEDVWTEEQQKGAVGSLNFWIEQKEIDEDLLVIAGDNYFEFDLSQFIAAYNEKNVLVAIHDIGDRSKARRFGVVQVDKNRVIKFEEKPLIPSSSLVATACYILPPHVFPILSQYCQQGKSNNLGAFIAHLSEVEEVCIYAFAELWLDIGSIEDYARAR